MTNLKDYLSSLVSGVNQARMLADFESARIAQIYAKDELLKTFSVPRFRLPDVEMTIPVAIESLETEPDRDYQPIDNISFSSQAYQVIKDLMQVESFDRTRSREIKNMLYEETSRLEKSIQANTPIDEGLASFGKNVTEQFLGIHKKASEGKRKMEAISKTDDRFPEELASELQERLRPEIQDREQSQGISNAKIVAEAHRLRELDPRSIIQIKMKLSEEGMEWTKIERDSGEDEYRLIPE